MTPKQNKALIKIIDAINNRQIIYKKRPHGWVEIDTPAQLSIGEVVGMVEDNAIKVGD